MKVIGKLSISLCGAALLLGSCIRDNLDDCTTGRYLKLVYDYNTAFEDLFHNQVRSVDLYVFSSNGTFLQKVEAEVNEGTFPRGYMLRLPDDVPANARLVAWCNADDAFYTMSAMTAGTSTVSDLTLSLIPDAATEPTLNAREIPALFHGAMTLDPAAAGTQKEPYTIGLTKDKNVFRVILQSLDDNQSMADRSFAFSVTAPNGSYNAQNQAANAATWTYRPYYSATDENDGAVAELNTLRLFADADNRLLITDTQTGEQIALNLTKYLNALKLQAYGTMPLQEFLDRQDTYSIIIFIRPDSFIAGEVNINGWTFHQQGSDLD